MRRLHLAVGAIALVVFLATGLYMDRVHAHLAGMADAPRMLYRSAHIYLLFGALANLLLGAYLHDAERGWRWWLQRAGSVALLATPFLFLLAFAVEPGLSDLQRPWARPGIELSLAGVLAHVIAGAAGTRVVPLSSHSTAAAGLDAARRSGTSTAADTPVTADEPR
jgi:multisubunit Na+/H+ antiporter MnhB subunit